MNVPLFLESLLILVQGMVGVFVVMAIIAIVICCSINWAL